MEGLRKEYADLRKEYTGVLKEALVEKDPERMNAYVKQLVDLNGKMSQVVGNMMSIIAQTESKVNLDELRGKLGDELLGIQSDVKSLENSRGERKVLQSIYDASVRQEKQESFFVYTYLFALGVGLLLVIITVLSTSYVSTPVSLTGGGLRTLLRGILQ